MFKSYYLNENDKIKLTSTHVYSLPVVSVEMYQ